MKTYHGESVLSEAVSNEQSAVGQSVARSENEGVGGEEGGVVVAELRNEC